MTTLIKLPAEIHNRIIQFLHTNDKLNYVSTCKQMRSMGAFIKIHIPKILSDCQLTRINNVYPRVTCKRGMKCQGCPNNADKYVRCKTCEWMLRDEHGRTRITTVHPICLVCSEINTSASCRRCYSKNRLCEITIKRQKYASCFCKPGTSRHKYIVTCYTCSLSAVQVSRVCVRIGQ